MSAINQITEQDVETFKRWCSGERNLADVYQKTSTKSALYPGQSEPVGLMYCALMLNGEAGELAEHVGKAMRDDGFGFVRINRNSLIAPIEHPYPLSPERRELIIKEVGDCLWYLSAMCNELGITLAHAMLTNLRKLADRTARNTLRGSGDER